MMNMESKASWKTGPQRKPAATGPVQLFLRLGGHSLSLASDIGALEECLALERSSRAGRPVDGSEGIQSPPAVPYCDFLTARSPDGRLQAVCRLMRLDQENTPGHPLKSGRFRLSPLLTAIRYSREGILEMGAIAFAPDCDEDMLAGLIWSGTIRFLERNGLGFVMGRESLAAGSATAEDRFSLMDAYGLHPDLEVDADARSHANRPSPSRNPAAAAPRDPTRAWPAGLREALRRGCRLACEPAPNPATGRHESIWVASRDMLAESAPMDWRGGCAA